MSELDKLKSAMSNTETNVVDKSTMVVHKKSTLQFVFTELALYLSQIFIFFVVAALSSNMLKDESALTSYISGKINDHSLEEVLYIIVATLFALGVLSALAKAFENVAWLESISDEVLNEAPRAIYFFGSSVTGTLIATAIFVHYHPSSDAAGVVRWVLMSLVFGLGGFMYGCGLSWAFRRKRYIKN